MAERLKARGGDDAGALVRVRDGYPNAMKYIKDQYRSQSYDYYDVGPDLLAAPRYGRKEVCHE